MQTLSSAHVEKLVLKRIDMFSGYGLATFKDVVETFTNSLCIQCSCVLLI